MKRLLVVLLVFVGCASAPKWDKDYCTWSGNTDHAAEVAAYLCDLYDTERMLGVRVEEKRDQFYIETWQDGGELVEGLRGMSKDQRVASVFWILAPARAFSGRWTAHDRGLKITVDWRAK